MLVVCLLLKEEKVQLRLSENNTYTKCAVIVIKSRFGAHPWYWRESVTESIRIMLELYRLNPFSGWQLSPAYFNSENNECFGQKC